MDSRILLLFEALDNNGWRKVGSINEKLDWKYNDVIEFKSNWSPGHKSIFISLLVDPYPSTTRSTNIWAVEISDKKPIESENHNVMVKSLNDLSRGGIESIVKMADSLRNKK